VTVTYRARVLSPVSRDEVRLIDDAVIVVDDEGRLEAVGPWSGGSCDADLRPHLLVPGFVDAHVHFPQTRSVGSASGPLLTWLAESIFPEEARFAEPSHAQQVAVEFCHSLASSGTTYALVYGSVHASASEILLNTMDAAGLRGLVGPVLMDTDCPVALQVPIERAVDELEGLAERWHGHDAGRLGVAVIPRFALSCSDAMLRGAADVADRLKLKLTTHLAETLAECQAVRERFGTDYLSAYADRGLLQVGAVFAHCIHLSEADWSRFQGAGAVVAHCPDSNYFLGSGNMPIDRVIEHQVEWAVGTDVAAGRSFRVPRTLSFAYDNARQRSADLSPRALFWRGTRGGALALGEARVGAIEPGLDADMSLWRVPPWAESADQLLGSLLFDHDAPPALATWVRGRPVWSTL
jgi:guanine deaminase